jgi:hypothetical protein
MSVRDITCNASLVKIGSGIQKLIGERHTQGNFRKEGRKAS